jgi:hypothetical protein
VYLLQQDCYLASGNFAAPLVRDWAASSCGRVQQQKQSEQIASAYALAERARHCELSRMGHMQPVFLLMAKLENLLKQSNN